MLAFLRAKASDLSIELETTLTTVNFDAYTDLNTLPAGDVIGLGELSMQTDSSDALEVVTAIIMVGTENDPNNMRLTKIVSELYDCLKPAQKIEYLDEVTGDEAGLMINFGETIVLPVEKDLVSKILQGISFMSGVSPA